MSKPVSVDFQFSIKQRGRGAKKRIVEGAAKFDESKPALERIPRISRVQGSCDPFRGSDQAGRRHRLR